MRVQLVARFAFWASLLFAYYEAIIPQPIHVAKSDKVEHMLAFGTIAFCGRLGFGRHSSLKLLLACVGFGAFIELSQAMPFVHRDASWADLAADTIATVAALCLSNLFVRLTGGRLVD